MQIIEVKNRLVSIIALIDDENKILIGKRPAGKAFENLWEFIKGTLSEHWLYLIYQKKKKKKHCKITFLETKSRVHPL